MDFVPNLPTLIAFTIAILLLAVTPGPDMTLWISRSLREGRAAGFMTLVGTNIGITVHTMLVAFGVAALIVASPTAFLILKTGGAAYLVWLAIQAIRKGSDFVMVKSTGEKAQPSLKSALLNGIWVNLLNPKIIIFFMTFLPQFVSASDPHVTGKLIFLGIWSIIVALPIGIGIVIAADVLSAWLQRNRKILRGLDYTIAGVFSLFAVKIFFTQTR
ncbi:MULTISPECIES: LysE family translocator [unclassified Agrobacterium]|jgi:threonine/homoserine/homoserine lactone efflux protein|uniref:LysE family translocator n=1 Tax=Agrobacterium fabrum TaxID=1176649 RepID=A0A2W5F5U0_9HYPH|nr:MULTISPECIES: LysE family translocator [unclassified Agrobacterium]PZP50778.1 MAG: LysE family translocator [Agrobacterium fabrum]MDH0614669.1 LysE family translocator [Agrobacterium sp. GD03872]MDH0697088.1 LysE family translocator [Agrobacterium sp. GD03871]MDH1059568.1 LysE family translocator [Agrobacterium sp. GD03992]MDH2212429.1 LysE family translocator [Agrobacterium sp. GD03643]